MLSCDDLAEDMAGLHIKFTDGLNKEVDRFDDRIRIQIVLTGQAVRSKTAIYNLKVIESLFNVKKKKKVNCVSIGSGSRFDSD